MPSARILSFGYDSAYVLSNSVADIDDAARSLIDRLDSERLEDRAENRPIIFIAHSLGGIVVKRALILAHERSDQWKNIRDSAAGLMPEYEEWGLKNNNKPLFIEYDSTRDWQVSLARVFEQDLQGQTELLWGFCPEHYNFEQLDDFKISLARSLIGQLITFRPDCAEKVNEILQEMQAYPGVKVQAKEFA